jgi:hypothetical protein
MTRLRELKESLAWIDDPTMTDGADPAARHWATECRSLISDMERARVLLRKVERLSPYSDKDFRLGGYFRVGDVSLVQEDIRAFLQEQEPSE